VQFEIQFAANKACVKGHCFNSKKEFFEKILEKSIFAPHP
jgi:hypothetical protein